MELAWRHDRLTVKKALFYLKDTRLAYTTVMTILGRLAEKGLLVKEKDGRTFVYRPAVSRERFLEEKLKKVTDCLKNNFKTTF